MIFDGPLFDADGAPGDRLLRAYVRLCDHLRAFPDCTPRGCCHGDLDRWTIDAWRSCWGSRSWTSVQAGLLCRRARLWSDRRRPRRRLAAPLNAQLPRLLDLFAPAAPVAQAAAADDLARRDVARAAGTYAPGADASRRLADRLTRWGAGLDGEQALDRAVTMLCHARTVTAVGTIDPPAQAGARVSPREAARAA